jgi:glyoxylase-like metal-dependent hydrolase (beta-lactamase superfamily II)
MKRDPLLIPVPLAHVGSVNVWLLPGEPLTLVDTGPRDDAALAALEAGLRAEGARIEDIELLLLTHHHVDHVGLAATIAQRSGATVAGLHALADYAERYDAEVEEDRRFSHRLMRHHGVPEPVVAGDEPFWDFLRHNAEPFEVDRRLRDGDELRAGGRTLRVVARPGHSTTDTLFVDEREALAFTGDHLLSRISSNTEIASPERCADGRARSRVRYLDGVRRTAGMPLRRLLTGHGAPVTGHGRLVTARLLEHERRGGRILAILEDGPSSAYAVAQRLWVARTVAEQPLLVVWEVLGHLELLLAAGHVVERRQDGGSLFELARDGRAAARPRRPPAAGRRDRHRRPDPAPVPQG